MSQPSEAKKRQGYVPKAVPSTCATCVYFQMDRVEKRAPWGGKPWTVETNLRCGLGGFAVKKMATCREWKAK